MDVSQRAATLLRTKKANRKGAEREKQGYGRNAQKRCKKTNKAEQRHESYAGNKLESERASEQARERASQSESKRRRERKRKR
eukprot:6180425-Pleurochrysis_carterae.AAC.2